MINSITKLHLVGISTESYYDERIHKYDTQIGVWSTMHCWRSDTVYYPPPVPISLYMFIISGEWGVFSFCGI